MPYRLKLQFEHGDAFAHAFERNLGMGGTFVPTGDPLQPGSTVELEVVFGDRDDRLRLHAQVVHVVPLERALSPLEAGVVVAFLDPEETLREKLEPYLAGSEPFGEEEGVDVDDLFAARPPPEATDATSFYAADTHFAPLVQQIESSSLSALEASLIELATVGLPTSRMLEVIPQEAHEIQEGLHSLVERGLLRVV